MNMGINRNIVECKAINDISAEVQKISINRNIVECKDVPMHFLLSSGLVLIETLWNVKDIVIPAP